MFHADPTSEEYQDIDAEYIDKIPEVEFWDRTKKNLFIFEDINFKRLKADQNNSSIGTMATFTTTATT